MKYKDKVISNLDMIANHLTSLKNIVENGNMNNELLRRELEKLAERINSVSEMVSLEDNDFSVLRQGINA